MSSPTVLRVLFTSIVALALAGAPNAAFSKHRGGGSRGGGGSHHGGSRSGGGFHSGKRGGGGFHGGGGGHFGGKSFRSVRSAAPRQTGGGSSRRFGGLAKRANSNSAYFGGNMAGSNGPRSINATAGRRLGSSDVRAIATGTRAPGMNFGWNRPPSAVSPARSWSSQGHSSWASAPRSISSSNSNRLPNAGLVSRSWSDQGQSSPASASRSPSSLNPNRPPNATSASRSWPGHAPKLTASSWLDANRGLSNSGNSRFGNSAFGRSSHPHSRTGPNADRFGSSRFGGEHPSDWGGTSFSRGSSFGGDDFSLVPDLFGLALNVGGFGLRGLGLEGLGLLGSGLSGIGQDAGLESRQRGPGPILYPNGNCACPHKPAQVQCQI